MHLKLLDILQVHYPPSPDVGYENECQNSVSLLPWTRQIYFKGSVLVPVPADSLRRTGQCLQ